LRLSAKYRFYHDDTNGLSVAVFRFHAFVALGLDF
jgi:hypothetical protein